MLEQLCIQVVLNKYSTLVPKEQGLIIHPKATSSSEKACKLKQKNKKIGRQIALYKQLPDSQPWRRHLNPVFHNRVERKQAKIQAV